MRNVVLLWVLLAGCAGEEKSPLPYYGVPAGSSGAAGAGGGAGAGGQAGAGAQGGASGAVVINEVDPSGDPADWVELFNRGAEPVDLSGWNVAQGYEGAPPE
ncbi:MAG: lamin tail domain-containing protein, partial [Polyangiaceae bacterium]|nr:lamin tail domain-containing protein [Polyangiaceae bacterium]